MKNRNLYFLILLPLLWGGVSCSDADKDDQLPVIDMTGDADYPMDCISLLRGETFTFHATFSDNIELGSYSIEMHHNFDHHTHSTSTAECELDPVKTAVNPFIFLEEYSIPGGLTTYFPTVQIEIPDTIDTGDYHFMVRLTDKAGWQALKGISVKIVDE
jgi:hypothetical protein